MSYPGGKSGSGVYQKIINQIPPHRVYIAPFLGHDAVMLYKRPAVASIGIDCDGAVVEWWRSSMIAENSGATICVPGLTVINCDAISFLNAYAWQGGEFVYCDPPYLFETRACGRKPRYTAEFGDIGQHEKLLNVLLALPCMVAISGYWSSLYNAMLRGWRTISYQTRTRGGQNVTEWLWMNYPEPSELHDYSYLGENYRQRERLARIRRNWVARLGRMDQLERYMLAAAIAESGGVVRRDPASMEKAIGAGA